MANMKSKDFISKAVDIAKNYNTLYVMGCFGAPLTGSNVNRYCTNHSYNKDAKRTTMIKAVADKNPPYYGFDCVNLIKSILWGWCGDKSKTYGGATYNSNGVPDINADSMIQKCTNVSTNFTNIIPGEAVWMTGHIGIYIGDGLVVEATPQWTNNVQFTALGNIGTKSGYNTRKWTKHGKLPYVDYSDYVAPIVTSSTTTSSSSNTYTRTQFIKDVQIALGLTPTGIADTTLLSKTITVSAKKNNRHKIVAPIQKWFNAIGYNCGTVDCIAGAKFTEATNKYQTYVLKYKRADGEITAKNAMWKSLLGLSGAITTQSVATAPTVKYFTKYTGTSGSITSALKAIGAQSSYTYRAKIAKVNNIKLYVGTGNQNTIMLNLLKQGKLIMP